MGCGLTIVSYTKQNINTKFSKDTEIVGVDNFMTAIFWTRYFIAAQGCNVKYNSLHKDNKSSILMEKNGRASISKLNEHINIWYLFITNKFNKG